MTHDTLHEVQERTGERKVFKHKLLLSLKDFLWKKMWRHAQRRRRLTTLRRSFHLDLFTATSDTLGQTAPASITSSHCVFLYKKTHDRKGATLTAPRLRHMTVTESQSSYMKPPNTEMHFRSDQNNKKKGDQWI